jgi:hypothetical protein
MTNNPNNVSEEVVNKFIDQLVADANMGEGLEMEVFSELKKDLKKRLENRMNATILAHIPEYKLEEFEKLLDKGDSNATQDFCSQNIPDLASIIAAEFLSFRSRYIS